MPLLLLCLQGDCHIEIGLPPDKACNSSLEDRDSVINRAPSKAVTHRDLTEFLKTLNSCFGKNNLILC